MKTALVLALASLFVSNAFADCASEITAFQNTITGNTQKLGKAFNALSAATRLGEQSLVDIANAVMSQAISDVASDTKTSKSAAFNACNRTGTCMRALVAFQNALTNGTQKLDKSYDLLSAASRLGEQSLVDAADATIRQAVLDVASGTKASKIEAFNACN